MIKPFLVAIDSALLKPKGHDWHTSSIKKGAVSYSGIDTDARWALVIPRAAYLIWIQAAGGV